MRRQRSQSHRRRRAGGGATPICRAAASVLDAHARHRRRVRHHLDAAQPLLGVSSARGTPAARSRQIAAAPASAVMAREARRRAPQRAFRLRRTRDEPRRVGKGFALDRVGVILRRRQCGTRCCPPGSSSLLAVGGRNRGWLIDITSPLVARSAAGASLPPRRRPRNQRRRRTVRRRRRPPLRSRHRSANRLAGGRRVERQRGRLERGDRRRPVDGVPGRRSRARGRLLPRASQRPGAGDARRRDEPTVFGGIPGVIVRAQTAVAR